jgi:hypothetical protein
VQHLEGTKHLANKSLKRKLSISQATLEEVTGKRPKSKHEILGQELCETLLAANIPPRKLQNPSLCSFLEKNMPIQLPSEATLRQKFLPACFKEVMEKIKKDLKTGPLWISTDCSRDAMG